jgi:chromosome segregation ATPase
MRNRANEYEIRRLDRRLEALETELSRLVHSRDPVLDELAQTRAEMIEDLQAEIAAARARLDELLG